MSTKRPKKSPPSSPVRPQLLQRAGTVAAQFQQALALHRSGQTTQAARLLHSLLQHAPQHVDALHMLGLLRTQAHDPLAGLALLDRAVALQPHFAPLHNNRGIALRALERWDEALASYERALALHSAYPDAHTNRGNVLYELGRYTDALASPACQHAQGASQVRPHLFDSFQRFKTGDFSMIHNVNEVTACANSYQFNKPKAHSAQNGPLVLATPSGKRATTSGGAAQWLPPCHHTATPSSRQRLHQHPQAGKRVVSLCGEWPATVHPKIAIKPGGVAENCSRGNQHLFLERGMEQGGGR